MTRPITLSLERFMQPMDHIGGRLTYHGCHHLSPRLLEDSSYTNLLYSLEGSVIDYGMENRIWQSGGIGVDLHGKRTHLSLERVVTLTKDLVKPGEHWLINTLTITGEIDGEDLLAHMSGVFGQ